MSGLDIVQKLQKGGLAAENVDVPIAIRVPASKGGETASNRYT